MINKRTLVTICLLSAVIYHFSYFFFLFGPSSRVSQYWIGPIAWFSVLILFGLYFGTNWRQFLNDDFIKYTFNLFILWTCICFARSILHLNAKDSLIPLVFDPSVGLSLFPVLFFIIGLNVQYFRPLNILFITYCSIVWVFSLFFSSYAELQIFLLMPLFYLIITYPIQRYASRILTLIVTIFVVVESLTNRSGILRILMSYIIVVFYYILLRGKINKTIMNVIIICLLLTPFYFLYRGINGEIIFQTVLSNNTRNIQENILQDTRTFLYFEVFQDLKTNGAFLLGKGILAGYSSETFQTFNRIYLEVGFLQILLKSGIIGFLLYSTLVISAILKVLRKSNSVFLKCLGILLASYYLLFFIENILAFQLSNVIIWLVIGMCHSEKLRGMNDLEIRALISKKYPIEIREPI